MINTIDISTQEAKKLLGLEENHFCDLKAIDVSPAKLTKALSAFSNSEGGELYIGIDDKSRIWRGFTNVESANGHIQTINEFFPLGNDALVEFLACESYTGLVLKVQVSKTIEIKTASDGTVYIRLGAQSIPVTDPERLITLKRDKGIVSFESDYVNCPEEIVTNSSNIIKFMLEIVPTGEPSEWLRKQRVLVKGKPTVAAVLLFAEEPQACLPKRCGLKISRYKTSDDIETRETLDFTPMSVEGCLYEQIIESVNETTRIIESVRLQTPDGSIVQVMYPQEAIHEIITNAVIHRDYSIADDIHIKIFDNRVEVISPGSLPGHITAENILFERFARNPSIVRLINKFPDPPNKDIGEGLNTAFESMRNLKLKPPVIEQVGKSVRVTLKHESLATPEESILLYLLEHDEIANRHAREICFIKSENEMKRIFQKMVRNGLLARIPGRAKRNSAYEITEKGKNVAQEYKI